MALNGRNYGDWLDAFIDYSKFGEAPRKMYFWVGASVLAGALRRRVWIDQAYFRWHPNMYVILVAPPGIVSKSTTATTGMRLLRQVPGIRFGPDVVTWQALVTAFTEAAESFPLGDEFITMSPITIESGEFGNLLNPQDKAMMDLLVSLWDGKEGAFEKRTKLSGNDSIINPWINIIACTTPSWIASSFPEYMIGGGFISRCVFVYAEEKRQYVAYPGLVVPDDLKEQEMRLVQDLEHISQNIVGEYKLTEDAVRWGEDWYRRHYTERRAVLDDNRLAGYIARKQTHMHKLGMILAAAKRDDLVIEAEDLDAANVMITDLEEEMSQVFTKIGRTDESIQVERFLAFLQKRGEMRMAEAYRFVHAYFPQAKDYEEVIKGLVRAGFIQLETRGSEMWIRALSQGAAAT